VIVLTAKVSYSQLSNYQQHKN